MADGLTPTHGWRASNTTGPLLIPIWYTPDMATPTGASVVSIDPDVLSGTPVFRGTRVPVAALFDHLAEGDPLEEFLEGFPSVTREMALSAIAEAGEAAAPV